MKRKLNIHKSQLCLKIKYLLTNCLKSQKNSRNASSTVMCHTMEPSIYNSLHDINFSPYGEKDM